MAKPQDFKKNDPRINRKGAPKRDWTWSGLLEKYAEEFEDNQKVKDAVVKKVFQLAKRGDMVAVKEIFNRMDGMPVQENKDKVEVTVLKGLVDVE